MQRLLYLIYLYRTFIIFTGLEVVCLWLIARNNPYQSSAFFSSSNRIAGKALEIREGIVGYFQLKEVNENLAIENAALRDALSRMEAAKGIPLSDTLIHNDSTARVAAVHVDSAMINQYDYLPAKVISNSTRMFKNYITINQGSNVGVRPGMGVINSDGVVGRVKAVSEHYATIYSLLHTDMRISSILHPAGSLGSVRWTGKDPREAHLMYIPRHVQVQKGDTVTTSGYNSLFPPGVMVGTVKSIQLQPNSAFYDIDIALSTDFSTLAYVYVVRNNLQPELDSLKTISIQEPDE